MITHYYSVRKFQNILNDRKCKVVFGSEKGYLHHYDWFKLFLKAADDVSISRKFEFKILIYWERAGFFFHFSYVV